MEDSHTICLKMPKHENSGFFGIFDGHSGSSCSNYVAKTLLPNIDEIDNFSKTDEISTAVMKTDTDFMTHPDYINKEDGSAGIFTIATLDNSTEKYTLINGNIGDSRTVLARKNSEGNYSAISCTFDHKPTDEQERRRIENAGGYVQMSRVDGQLALSRAFGDRILKTPTSLPLKERKVTSYPDFVTETATKEDFLFLACDGIYEGEIFTRESAVNWIAEKMKETQDLALICAMILDECLDRGSRDNMSAMIIQFVDGTNYHSNENEYLPGPLYFEEGDSKFQDAYTRDAQSAGFTLDQAMELRKKLETTNNSQKESD